MLIPISIALSFFFAVAPAEPTPSGAKELFFNPVDGQISSVSPPPVRKQGRDRPVRQTDSSPVSNPIADPGKASGSILPAKVETQRTLGLSYWIELRDGEGRGTQVTDQRIFRSGERIRLHFRSNADGRIVLLQMGTSGGGSVLFPDALKGVADNGIAAHEDRILPSEAIWFRFDDKPGTERILALFARSEEDLGPLPDEAERRAETVQALLRTTEKVRGSKDLIVETETRNAAEIGTYGVNLAGKPVVLEIVLRHE